MTIAINANVIQTDNEFENCWGALELSAIALILGKAELRGFGNIKNRIAVFNEVKIIVGAALGTKAGFLSGFERLVCDALLGKPISKTYENGLTEAYIQNGAAYVRDWVKDKSTSSSENLNDCTVSGQRESIIDSKNCASFVHGNVRVVTKPMRNTGGFGSCKYQG